MNPRVRQRTRREPQRPRGADARARRAFTTIELLVSTGLMIVAMIGVVAVFRISSFAASKTAAHAEMLETSAALQDTLAHQLSLLTPGLLIIESPTPTLARAEVPNGPPVFRVRHDRLVFLASGSSEEFQSFTDSRRGTPFSLATQPISSREALVTFGPGIVVDVTGVERRFDDESIALTASEWTFMHRALLLRQAGAPPSAAGSPPPPPAWTSGAPLDMALLTGAGGMLYGGSLESRFLRGQADVIFAKVSAPTQLASAATIADNVADPAHLYPYDDFRALWQPSWTPVTTSLTLGTGIDPYPADFPTRSGFTFTPRLADFRIEWTDGRRIDPNGPDDVPLTGDEDLRTRWFGLAPDSSLGSPDPDPSNVASIDGMYYVARMRGVAGITNPSNPNVDNPDNPPEETAAFAAIESSPTGIAPDRDAAYRAVWRLQNWQYRPKALRFTYRLYDPQSRINQSTTLDLNENGIADPDTAGPPSMKPSVMRYGLEFSVVVALP